VYVLQGWQKVAQAVYNGHVFFGSCTTTDAGGGGGIGGKGGPGIGGGYGSGNPM
jgi:hypothetical protein